MDASQPDRALVQPAFFADTLLDGLPGSEEKAGQDGAGGTGLHDVNADSALLDEVSCTMFNDSNKQSSSFKCLIRCVLVWHRHSITLPLS